MLFYPVLVLRSVNSVEITPPGKNDSFAKEQIEIMKVLR